MPVVACDNARIMLLAWTFPSLPEIAEALPVILSLIIIEGLLSVDNALAIAAMASHLPGRQKYLALQLGIIGAYLFRGVCLAFATFIIANPWLKILGAAYLVYLMASHMSAKHEEEAADVAPQKGGFWATLFAIEIMDLSLSVDNVVAAVAMSPKLWVVCTGVFIGILALRFLAGYCIKLVERFPILEPTAFILIGYVGCLLLAEMLFHIDVGTLGKFVGICLIIAIALAYQKTAAVRAILDPLSRVVCWPLRLYAAIVNVPVGFVMRGVCALFAKRS